MIKGRIIKQISNDYTVRADKDYICKPRGKFRNINLSPLVGDFVIIDEKNNYIMDILPRVNELKRPRCCNIDQAVIITSLKNPSFDTNLLDKLLIIIGYNNIKPIIVFTKGDLLTLDEFKKFDLYFNYYKKIGYDVYMNTEISKLKKIFSDKVSVFTGQTGAGKSTLLNRLDSSLNLKTGDISYALNRGKHTTRHTELIEMLGGLIADTPGFSALDFHDMSKSDIRDNVTEFNLYRADCKYRNCMHYKENACAVKYHVENGDILFSRYNNYINFIKGD